MRNNDKLHPKPFSINTLFLKIGCVAVLAVGLPYLAFHAPIRPALEGFDLWAIQMENQKYIAGAVFVAILFMVYIMAKRYSG
jgi:hypothetical protein